MPCGVTISMMINLLRTDLASMPATHKVGDSTQDVH